ncbi:MAG TPA: PAS domain S-box protein, partial [Nodosilinea sp.]|nr:PAS domain S-box protein [Nodosilinea sp.]
MANPYNPSGPTDNPRTVLLLDRAGNSADTYQRLLQPEAGRYQILAQPYDGPVLDLCRSQSVDHILVESHFPDTRGFELIQRLKTQLGDQCPPIIVVDENDADLAMRAVKAGAADYLVRGQITAERLEQALGQAMEVAMPTLGSASHPAAYRRQQERERFLAVGSDLQAITSRDGRFQWVSPSFERLLGWTAAEMVSHAWSEFVHGEDVSPSTTEAEHLFSGTETLAFENRFRHKDGSYRWLLWRLQLDLEQQVSYGTAIDISVLKQFESALHASRDELVQRSHIFEAMLSTISDFVYLFDREGRFVFVNQPLLDLWGLTLADAVGKNFFDLNYPNALAAKQQQEIERVFTTGQSVRDEASYTSPTGKGGVYEYIFTPLLGPDGSVQSVVGSTRDVTERKQSEAMLRESEERFRLMADTVPQIIWITDAQGRVKFVNQQWRAYTGASYESATAAEALVSFVHPQDVALTMKGFSQALQVGGSFRAEHRIRSAEGTYRWFLIQAEPYRDPTTGAIERWFGTLVDIHDRKFAEAALLESEAKYRSLFNSMNEGFCILQVIVEGDRQPIDYRYVEVNPAFEQHTGLSNVLGKTIRELVPDIEPAWFDFYSSVALTGEPARFEYQVEALERWFDSSAFRIGDPHERRIAVLFSDITKRKQTQIQLHHAAAMDAFQVALSDALRMLSDPIEVQAAACRLLGEKLNTSRVYYYEYNQDTLSGVVHHDYRQSGENSIAGVYNFEDFVSVHTLLHTGQPLVLTDVANSTVLTEGERFRFKALNFGALVSIPLVKDRRLVAVFSVVQSSPRQWTSLELSLIQATAERTWTDVERARVEAALRESEAKYRTLFTSIDEGYFLVDVIFDDDNQPVDVLYLDANPSATRMVGHDFAGQRLSEIDPNYEFYWYDIFGRVASTGVSQRLERYAEPDKKWYDFYAFKVGEQDNHRVAVVFQDITERKRREANAAFVAAITEDFSRLSSADEIMQAVGAKVGAYLNVSSCLFAEINEAQ